MKGLILAAGRGSRLGRYNATAKCLLEVAGRRLIDYQLEACAEAGVAPVALVVGFAADDVREAVGIKAEYIHNARWEFTNSLYSFQLAREWIDGPIVVMNSDILFHPEILTRVLAVKGDAFAYDSGSGQAPEHMKVEVEDGRLKDMSKELPTPRSAGENVGILVFSADGARALLDKATAIAATDGGERNWLGAAVRELARERVIRAVDIAGLPWGEIDSTFDLDNVRKNVWPRIQRSTPKRRRQRRLLLGAGAAALAAAMTVLALLAFQSRGGASAVDRAWETVDLAAGVETRPLVDGRPQRWRLLGEKETAWINVTGPGSLRVETRLVLPSGAPDRVPYVVRVQMGRNYDLYKRTTRVDPAATLEGTPLGKRKREDFTLPAGDHRIGISLLGADRMLLRVRQPEAPDRGDDDADDGDAGTHVGALPAGD